MNLIFDSAEILSSQYSFDYIGSNYCFRKSNNITLNGVLLKESGFNGVTAIWSDIGSILNSNKDYQNILINGVSFGSGILNSINFAQNNDVRTKRYTAQITIFETGDLSFLGSGYFSNLTGLSGIDLRLLSSISEQSTYSRNNNLSLTFDRNVNFSLQSGSTGENTQLINIAKGLVTELLSKNYNYNFIYSGIPSGFQPKRVMSESYDIIGSSYSFRERIDYREQAPYDWSYVHSLSLDENGEVIVSEKGVIREVSAFNMSGALSCYSGVQAGSYSRCNDFFAQIYGVGCALGETATNNQVSISHNEGVINYDLSYSTNPRFSGGCVWSYSHTHSQNNGIYLSFERGDIIGRGTGIEKYNNAFSCFTGQISTGKLSRASGVFNAENVDSACFPGLYFESQEVTDYEDEGKISYQFNFSTDYRYSGVSGYNYFASGFTNNSPIHLKTVVGIINDNNSDYAISNFRNNSTLGTFTFQFETLISGLSDFNNFVFNLSSGLVNTGEIPSNNFYLSDANFEFDSQSLKVRADVATSYVRHRTKNNILV